MISPVSILRDIPYATMSLASCSLFASFICCPLDLKRAYTSTNNDLIAPRKLSTSFFVPTVIFKQPKHPGSFPRNRSTILFSLAKRLVHSHGH